MSLSLAMHVGSCVEARSRLKRQSRHEGICDQAKALGVSRVHLWKVLTGRRTSQSLMREYRKIKKEAA